MAPDRVVRRSPGRALLAVVADALLVGVAGFCAIAMGLGRPFWLFMIGLAAVAGFGSRRRTWWGLATALAASVAGVGVLYGFGITLLVEISMGLFVVVAVTRLATHHRGGEAAAAVAPVRHDGRRAERRAF